MNGDRPYLVQEWVEGQTLEALVECGAKVRVDDALNILDNLFLNLVIPAWSKGSKWWDARHSNYIYTPDKRVVMIDPDVLADYAEEIVLTPSTYTKRNTCNPNTAIARFISFIVDMAMTCKDTGQQKPSRAEVKTLCKTHLKPEFCRPYPYPTDWKEKATLAYQNFHAQFKELLKPAGQLAKSTGRPLKQTKREKRKNEKEMARV